VGKIKAVQLEYSEA
jgi:26S proteasome regulatory subunit N3